MLESFDFWTKQAKFEFRVIGTKFRLSFKSELGEFYFIHCSEIDLWSRTSEKWNRNVDCEITQKTFL